MKNLLKVLLIILAFVSVAGAATALRVLEIDYTTPPSTNNYVKFDGTKWVSGTITATEVPVVGPTRGGTGLTSYTQGDTLYASATNVLSKLAKDTNSTRALCNTGTSNNPAWCQIALTTGITGTLPVANGGTNLTALGSANQVLGVNSGASGLEYKTITSGTSGTDFAVAHSANTVTLNLPDASASNRGVVTTGTQTFAGAKTFNSSVTASSFELTTGTWTPGVEASAGTYTSVTIRYARYVKLGKFYFCMVSIDGTTNTTPTYLKFTLPAATANLGFNQVVPAATSIGATTSIVNMSVAILNNNSVDAYVYQNADGSTPWGGGAGQDYYLNFLYEAA